MRHAWFSEKGPRAGNEDCCGVLERGDNRALFVVCDGMGGHFGGEVSSRAVCDAFTACWQEHDDMDSLQQVLHATRQASAAIDRLSGSCPTGTTLVMASIEGNQATIAHAGDSRCYVIDIKGNVKYRTIDHITSSPLGHQEITRAFFSGRPECAVPDVKIVPLSPLDRILLCSDGLYNAIDEESLLHILQCAKDVEHVANKYRAICKEEATDNYTGIIIEIE